MNFPSWEGIKGWVKLFDGLVFSLMDLTLTITTRFKSLPLLKNIIKLLSTFDLHR